MVSEERAQSAPLGVALLLGIVILGTTAVVAFGGAALTDTQHQANLARAEQSMALFDSQAAQVALGASSVQTVELGRGEGTYAVNPTAGEITIIQLDCDDTDDLGNNLGGYDPATDTLSSDDYRYFESDLGSVTYESGDTTLAYQGGGVWQRDDGVQMVSPPEFHFRGATLTFPVVLTRGSGGAGGSASATITRTSVTRQFSLPGQEYPDGSTASEPDCQNSASTEHLTNPVTDGSVVVRIESKYARGWGEYFETRTSGDVNYYDTDSDGKKDDVVLIRLVSLGQVGNFGIPNDGSSQTIPGASGAHATEKFTITLKPDGSDSAKFNNLQWSMYVDEGSQHLEIYLKKGSGGDANCGDDGSTDLKADLTVYYSPDGGDTYYGWQKDDAYAAECENYDTSDPEKEIKLVADFVDDEDGDDDNPSSSDDFKLWTDIEETSQAGVSKGDPKLEYVDKSSMNNLVHFGIQGSDTAPDPYDLTGHGGTDPWEPASYSINSGDTETVDRLVNHYFALLPNGFALTVDDKGSDTINEGASFGEIQTGGGGRYITFLHVTTNEVEVEIES